MTSALIGNTKLSSRRYFNPSTNSASLGMDFSSMVLMVDTISSVLIFNVASFMAWELSSELYFKQNPVNRQYLIQSIMEDAGNARIDLYSLLAMRANEPNLLIDSMNPVTVLVPSSGVDLLAYFDLKEIDAIRQIQVRVSNQNIDREIDGLLSLKLKVLRQSKKISFVAEGDVDVELTIAQLFKLKQIGELEKKTSEGGNFHLAIPALSTLSAGELSAIASSASALNINMPSLISIEVGFSIHDSLQELRKLPSMRKSWYKLDLAAGVEPFVSESDLSFLRYHKNIKIAFFDPSDDLILRFPSVRALQSNLLSIDKLLAFSKDGVTKFSVDNASDNSFLDISVPNFSVLEHLGILVDNIPLHIQVINNDDLRRLVELPLGKNSEKSFISFRDFSSLDLNSMYKLVYAGMGLYDQRTLTPNAVVLTDGDVKKIDSNPAEWLHLLVRTGIHTMNFLYPTELSQKFTEALVSENLSILNQAEGDDAVVAGIVINGKSLSTGRVDSNFFNKDDAVQIESLVETSNIDRLFISAAVGAEGNVDLDVSLQVFATWAKNGHLDFGGASAKIPEEWMQSFSPQNVVPEFLETNLNITIVGVSSDNMVHLQIP